MTFDFISFFTLGALLISVFVWVLHQPASRKGVSKDDVSLEESGRTHITYLPQIRQALAPADLAYLYARMPGPLAQKVQKQRRKIALSYISALRNDFQSLLHLSRVIATLSPEIAAAHEFERFRLSLEFSWRYLMIRIRLRCGATPSAAVGSLSDMMSGLHVRMETAIRELAKRSVLAGELRSSLDGRGLDST